MYTVREPLRHAVSQHRHRVATVCAGRTQTYQQLADRVARVGAMLSTVTDPGDRVALWANNSDRYLELFIGIPAAGRVVVPHNTRWAEPELAYATTDSGTRVLICDRDPGELAALVDLVIRLDRGDYESRLATADVSRFDPPKLTPDLTAGLFYTGGTTGTSKGVMLSHANLMANAVHTQLVQPFQPDDRYLTVAPMFHAAGDRAKDMIVTGGENVYCTEVEDAIYQYPGVLEATVFGVPDKRWGEAVHAVVVPRPDTTLTKAELIAHCRNLIAAYKVPKSVSFRTEPLPKSGPGKILKRELRAPFWKGRERSIN